MRMAAVIACLAGMGVGMGVTVASAVVVIVNVSVMVMFAVCVVMPGMRMGVMVMIVVVMRVCRLPLAVEEPRSKQRDQSPADRLQPCLQAADLDARRLECDGDGADDGDGRQGLDQRRHERQQGGPPRRALGGERIGRNDELAMTGANCVQHAVDEADGGQRECGRGAAFRFQAAHGR
jgi:hypothetical protein